MSKFSLAGLSKSIYESIIESSDDAIVSKTLEGIVTSWNPAAERIYGYTAEEMIGRPMTTVFPSDRLHEEEEILATISRGERVAHFKTVRVRKDGTLIDISATISPIFDDSGRVVGASKIARDITAMVRAEKIIWEQAHHDALTGAVNRRYFWERLEQEVARSDRSGKCVALVVADLDHFKEINDTMGHLSGDALLSQAAELIRGAMREIDVIGRVGGDEFAIIVPEIAQVCEVEGIAGRLRDALSVPYSLMPGDQKIKIAVSIGIAVYPEHAHDAEALFLKADQAMYESKRFGRNRVTVFGKIGNGSQAMFSKQKKILVKS